MMRRWFGALVSLLGFGATAAFAIGPERESWSSFLRKHPDADVSTVLVDLDLMRWLAENPRGSEISVSVDIKDPTENGLPTKAELAFLYVIEDKIVSQLRQNGQGRLIGHVFGQGKATYFVFASGPGDDLLEMLNDVTVGLHVSMSSGVVPVDSAHIDDHVLVPTRAENQVVKDTMVLTQLAQNGDIAETPRDIEHWAFFPDSSRADQFARSIGAEGMNVLNVGPSAQWSGQFQVHFSHFGTVLPDDISGVTVRLDDMAMQLGGQYDGWETPVMRPLQ